jgi:CBS domain-containing protein
VSDSDPVLETAGKLAVCRVPTARAEATMGEVLDRLQGHHWDETDTVFVVDGEDRLVGSVPLGELLAAPREARIGAHARVPVFVTPGVDQERTCSASSCTSRSSASSFVSKRAPRESVPPEVTDRTLPAAGSQSRSQVASSDPSRSDQE